jgi:hypothetical protein
VQHFPAELIMATGSADRAGGFTHLELPPPYGHLILDVGVHRELLDDGAERGDLALSAHLTRWRRRQKS